MSTAAKSSRTARSTIRLMIGRTLFLGSGYVITVILARGLGPADYGTYGLLMSLLLWLEGMTGLGIPRTTIRLMPGAEDPEMLAQSARALLFAISSALFALCWLAAPYVAEFFAIADGTMLFRVAVLDLPVYGLYVAYNGILQGREQFGRLTAALIVYAAAKLAGMSALFVVGFSVAAALVVNVVATVVALAFVLGLDRPRVALPSAAFLRGLLRLALPLSVFEIAFQLLLSGHLWLVKRLSDASEAVIGHYVAALNIARLPTFVTTVLSGVVLAAISRAYARGDAALALRYLRSASRFVLVLVLPACVLGALHAEPLVVLVYAEEYRAGASFFGLLLIAFGGLALTAALLNASIAAGRHFAATVVAVALVPLLGFLCAWLIRALGPAGAAAAFLATIGCGLAASLALAYRHVGPAVDPRTVLRTAAATAVVAALSRQVDVEGVWVLVELAGWMAAYFAILAGIGELTREDLGPLAVWRKDQ